jgi:hypothetical protein
VQLPLRRHHGRAAANPRLCSRQACDHLPAVGRAQDQRFIDCPGRKPPFSAVKRPACPCKSAIQNRSTMEIAKGA